MTDNINVNDMGAETNGEELTQPYRVFDTKEAWQGEIDRIFASRFKSERISKKQNVASMKERLNARVNEIKEGLDLLSEKSVNAKELIKNSEFCERLKKGYSVEDAYYLSQRSEKPVFKDNAAGAVRPKENGAKAPSAGVGRPDVSAMNRKEFAKLLTEVRNGKTIN